MSGWEYGRSLLTIFSATASFPFHSASTSGSQSKEIRASSSPLRLNFSTNLSRGEALEEEEEEKEEEEEEERGHPLC